MDTSFPSSPVQSSQRTSRPALACSPRQHRYVVWSQQLEGGFEPCFGTERRLLCDESTCIWRKECMGLRAEWMR